MSAQQAGAMTKQMKRDNDELLIRIHLGLNPAHDLLNAVRVLHDEGREAFEKMRGERCAWSHEWKPNT